MPRKRKAPAVRQDGRKFSHDGVPSVFTCPDCSGTLFIVKQGPIVQFRCRVGHLYSPESMLEAQNDNVERSLWTAVRALQEKAEYALQMAEQVARVRDRSTEERYAAQSRDALQSSVVIRDVIGKATTR